MTDDDDDCRRFSRFVDSKVGLGDGCEGLGTANTAQSHAHHLQGRGSMRCILTFAMHSPSLRAAQTLLSAQQLGIHAKSCQIHSDLRLRKKSRLAACSRLVALCCLEPRYVVQAC